jgi:hypothetical protein
MPPQAFMPPFFATAPPVPDPKGRGKLVALLVGVVVLLCAIGGGVVFATHHGSTPTAIQSPTEANSALYAAAMASGSFHYVDVSSGSVGGKAATGTLTGDVGLTEGVQTMTSDLGNYQVIVINAVAYMKADVTMLENNFGYSASQAAPYADRWIEFTASDSPYSAIAADLTTGSTWGNPSNSPSNGLPHTPESVTPVSTMNGQSVQSVLYSQNGSEKATNGSYTGTETIVFAASEPHLPSYATEQLSGTVNGQPSTSSDRVTFSQWGEPVTLTAPTGAIPYSALPTPSASASASTSTSA